jgi:hypothetical protein
MATNNNYSGPELFCLWPSEMMLDILPIKKPFEPVINQEDGLQRIDDATGLPLWKNSVKIRAGWNGDLSTIYLRFAAKEAPLVKQLNALEEFLAQGHTKAELANLLSLAEAEEVNK